LVYRVISPREVKIVSAANPVSLHPQVFGAVCSCPPRVTEHFCGTGESFLFKLEPKMEVFRWSGENMFFVKGDPESLKIGGGE